MKYEKAQAKVVMFDNSDVITTSDPSPEEIYNCVSSWNGTLCLLTGENPGDATCVAGVGVYSN